MAALRLQPVVIGGIGGRPALAKSSPSAKANKHCQAKSAMSWLNTGFN
jgi:hypothetical protein